MSRSISKTSSKSRWAGFGLGLVAALLLALIPSAAWAGDGPVDPDFTTSVGPSGFNDAITAMAVQSDGKLVVGGLFTTLNGTTVNRLARLNADGSPDTTFNTNIGTGFNGQVRAIAFQASGSIVVGGDFTDVNGVTVGHIVRLSSSGTPDSGFTTAIGSGFNLRVYSLGVQSADKIVVGGEFTQLGGTSQRGLALLDSDGTRNAAFGTALTAGGGLSDSVFGLAVQSDNAIVVGGAFLTVDGVTVNRIGRINADGTTDTTFDSHVGTGFNAAPLAVALQSTGKVIVGGIFTGLNGTTVDYIARLGADGTPDTTFTSNTGAAFDGGLNAVLVQSDDQIVAGGAFLKVNNQPNRYLARLAADGTPDLEFAENLTPAYGYGTGYGDGVGTTVMALGRQSTGKIVAGGYFQTINGQDAFRILRLGGAAHAQSIAFTTPADASISAGTKTVTAAAHSYFSTFFPLEVSFASLTPQVCSINSVAVNAQATVTLLAPGTCTVRATQSGDSTWAAAAPVDKSFTVTPLVLAQTPAGNCSNLKLPSKLKKNKTTTLLKKKGCLTNAGQRIKVRAQSTRDLERAVTYRLVTKKNGLVSIRPTKKSGIIVTLFAPATGNYSAYESSKVYRIK